ncbi:MAG: glycosyltransferase family 2 protein [Thermoanaerobaculia bacterium]
MIDCEVIVPDLDGGEHLDRCLASLAAQSDLPRRVLVFDNGSKSPAKERVKPDPRLVVDMIRSETNLGFAGGMNAAMREVTAPLVAWINNDVVLDPAWLARLTARINSDARLGGVQSRILTGDGSIDGAGVDISDGTYRQLGHGRSTLEAEDRGNLWGVSGTAALFRTVALHRVALRSGAILHPVFFAWYEDVELCARMREAGWIFDLVDEPLATHAGSSSAGQLADYARHLRIRNRYFVVRLHPGAGRWGALVAEDIRRLGRELIAGDFHGASITAIAFADGILSRIDG